MNVVANWVMSNQGPLTCQIEVEDVSGSYIDACELLMHNHMPITIDLHGGPTVKGHITEMGIEQIPIELFGVPNLSGRTPVTRTLTMTILVIP